MPTQILPFEINEVLEAGARIGISNARIESLLRHVLRGQLSAFATSLRRVHERIAAGKWRRAGDDVIRCLGSKQRRSHTSALADEGLHAGFVVRADRRIELEIQTRRAVRAIGKFRERRCFERASGRPLQGWGEASQPLPDL